MIFYVTIEGYKYSSTDNGFMLVAEFIERWTGFREVAPMTTIDTIYSHISDSFTTDGRWKGCCLEDGLRSKEDINYLKMALVEKLHGNYDI